jgi:hypothetical protein
MNEGVGANSFRTKGQKRHHAGLVVSMATRSLVEFLTLFSNLCCSPLVRAWLLFNFYDLPSDAFCQRHQSLPVPNLVGPTHWGMKPWMSPSGLWGFSQPLGFLWDTEQCLLQTAPSNKQGEKKDTFLSSSQGQSCHDTSPILGLSFLTSQNMVAECSEWFRLDMNNLCSNPNSAIQNFLVFSVSQLPDVKKSQGC